jgi:hypothetical protein
LMAGFSFNSNAQLWPISNDVPGHSETANRNGTYPFQYNPNNNMGTSPNNAVYKNQAEFYNKDNNQRNLFPESNGRHFTPGSQGYNYNGANYINTNTPGSNNNLDINGRQAPVYNNLNDPNSPVKR